MKLYEFLNFLQILFFIDSNVIDSNVIDSMLLIKYFKV